MARPRREVADSGLAFLDVVSCGFGAIILLLIITKTVAPQDTTASAEGLRGDAQILQNAVLEAQAARERLAAERDALERTVAERRAQLAAQEAAQAALREKSQRAVETLAEAEERGRALAEAKQSLSETLQRLLGQNYRARNDLVGGIPADSEYIIFIIDTSGSMFNYAWDMMTQKLLETLEVYPEVKGIQVMNDMGEYMFSSYAGQWIPDTPGRRAIITDRLRSWSPFSNSSPVEGITRAINTFWAPDRKISLYVFGDEFTGPSIEAVIDTVDRINRADASGQRRVRIHGVGFPVQFAAPPQYQNTGERFASLMRELARRNGGTFVGLERFR
jgi:hypothetical protein